MDQLRQYWGVVVLFTVVIGLLVPVAQAEEKSGTLKWRVVTHRDKTQETADICDVEGHRLAVAEGSGVGIFANDELATFSYQVMNDTVKGGGAFHLYGVYTFEDGATIRVEANGTFGSWGAKAEAKFVSGTGRFAGIKGSYSVKPVGRRGNYTIVDAIGTYTAVSQLKNLSYDLIHFLIRGLRADKTCVV
jgi:hypothetical protein